jgi:AhpD family alkylhydroperoxidase
MMRVPPPQNDTWDEHARTALAVLSDGDRRDRGDRGEAGDALATLVRHPDLAEALLTVNTHLLLRSTLPPRLRELAILRVARRRDCEYQWTHHARLAAEAGLTEAEIEAAGRGEAADALELAVLDAVDELDDDSALSARTSAALGEHLDEHQRMDLVFTIGTYCMLAMAFNTFGVEPGGGPGAARPAADSPAPAPR